MLRGQAVVLTWRGEQTRTGCSQAGSPVAAWVTDASGRQQRLRSTVSLPEYTLRPVAGQRPGRVRNGDPRSVASRSGPAVAVPVSHLPGLRARQARGARRAHCPATKAAREEQTRGERILGPRRATMAVPAAGGSHHGVAPRNPTSRESALTCGKETDFPAPDHRRAAYPDAGRGSSYRPRRPARWRRGRVLVCCGLLDHCNNRLPWLQSGEPQILLSRYHLQAVGWRRTGGSDCADRRKLQSPLARPEVPSRSSGGPKTVDPALVPQLPQ